VRTDELPPTGAIPPRRSKAGKRSQDQRTPNRGSPRPARRLGADPEDVPSLRGNKQPTPKQKVGQPAPEPPPKQSPTVAVEEGEGTDEKEVRGGGDSFGELRSDNRETDGYLGLDVGPKLYFVSRLNIGIREETS